MKCCSTSAESLVGKCSLCKPLFLIELRKCFEVFQTQLNKRQKIEAISWKQIVSRKRAATFWSTGFQSCGIISWNQLRLFSYFHLTLYLYIYICVYVYAYCFFSKCNLTLSSFYVSTSPPPQKKENKYTSSSSTLVIGRSKYFSTCDDIQSMYYNAYRKKWKINKAFPVTGRGGP
jgi:hypothetical protein